MLISKIGTLTKQIIWLGSVTFSGKVPMRGPYVFLTAKYSNLYGQFIFQLLFPQIQPLTSFKRLCYLVRLFS